MCLPLLLFSLALGKIEVIIHCSVVQGAVGSTDVLTNWNVESHRTWREVPVMILSLIKPHVSMRIDLGEILV